MEDVAIIGVGRHAFGRFPGKSAFDMGADAMMSDDAMMSEDSMMSEDDAMAAECMAKAEMETDQDKMQMMLDECHEMYPDAMMEDDAM